MRRRRNRRAQSDCVSRVRSAAGSGSVGNLGLQLGSTADPSRLIDMNAMRESISNQEVVRSMYDRDPGESERVLL